jgi:hypothetical protein
MGNCIQGNSVVGDPKIVPIKRGASLKKSAKNTDTIPTYPSI